MRSTHVHIRHREDALAIGNASLEPVLVDATRQAHQFALVQRQLNGGLRMKIELGPRLAFGRLPGVRHAGTVA